MRSLSFIVSFFVLLQFSFAQTGSIGMPGVNEYASSVIADNSGNTYIGGSSGGAVLLLKRDASGEILWSNTIALNGTSDQVEVNDILLVGDTIFGCGHTRDAASYIQGSAYFKINATTGSCYWLKYDLTSRTYFSSIQYYQGKLVMCGSRVSYPSPGPYDGKVIAVNSVSGNLLWETPAFGILFTSSSADFIDDFQASSTIENGKMYITGRSYVDGAPLNMRPTLIGIDVDNNGNIFLSKYLTYEINTDFSRVYGTSVQRDGNELVVGFVGDYLCSSCDNYRTGLLKCDLNGNVIWSKYYDITGAVSEFNKNVNITPDGYVIYGQAIFGSDIRMILLKTNKQGDFLLGKSIGQSGQYFCAYNPGIYSITCNSDFKNGMHHFVGSKYQNNANERDIFYLKANNINLEGDNSCYTYEDFTVSTTSITPASGNVLPSLYSYPITHSTVSLATSVNTGGCSNITVSQQHTNTCGNDTITLTVNGIDNPEYAWSNGGTGNQVIATTLDTLFVTIHDPVTCCSYQEIVVPAFLYANDVVVELPADTSLCLQSSETLQIDAVVTSGQTGVVYSWNTGQNTASIQVSNSGTYIVTVQSGCSVGKDTIAVSITHFPEVDLGSDLTLCPAQFPYELNPASVDVDTWLWSTGETTPTITVNGPETISVNVFNTCGSDSDELEITQQVLPEVDLMPQVDTCLAPGQGLLIAAIVSGTSDISWSNGQSGIETIVYNSGIYTVTASNACETVSSSINVGIYHPFTQELPDSIHTCDGFVVLSDYIPAIFNITSSDMDLSNVYVVESGWIYCHAETECGNYSDSVFVDVNTSNLLFFQNSFTPNNDEVNDVLELMVPDLKIVSIEIFNRWGESVYREENSFSGWNGTYKGKICSDGVYQVQLIYANCVGIDVQFNGHVSLLK